MQSDSIKSYSHGKWVVEGNKIYYLSDIKISTNNLFEIDAQERSQIGQMVATKILLEDQKEFLVPTHILKKVIKIDEVHVLKGIKADLFKILIDYYDENEDVVNNFDITKQNVCELAEVAKLLKLESLKKVIDFRKKQFDENELEELFNKTKWDSLDPDFLAKITLDLVLKWLSKCAELLEKPILISNCLKFLKTKHPEVLKQMPPPVFKISKGVCFCKKLTDSSIQLACQKNPIPVNKEIIFLKCPSLSEPEKMDTFLSHPCAFELLEFLHKEILSVSLENYLQLAELADQLKYQELLRAIDDWAIRNVYVDEYNAKSLWQMIKGLNKLKAKVEESLLVWAHSTSNELGWWFFCTPTMSFLINNRENVSSFNLNKLPLNALKNYPHIRSITLAPETTKGEIESILKSCPKLEELHAEGNRYFDDEAFHWLIYLKIQVIDIRNCPKISSKAFLSICEMDQLRVLRCGQENLKMDCLHFKSLMILSHLEELEIGRSSNFGCEAMEIVRQIPFLRRLILSSNIHLTDQTLNSLKNHPSLEKINLNNCGNITDEGLKIVSTIPKLTHAELQRLPLISIQGVKTLLQHPFARYLDLSGCRGFTWEQVYLLPNADKTYIEYDHKVLSEIPWSDQLPKQLLAYFDYRSSRITRTQSLEPFSINDFSYIAYSPNFHTKTVGQPISTFLDGVENIKPKLVINLMGEGEKDSYIENPEFNNRFSLLAKGEERDFYVSKNILYIHVKNWKDGETPKENTIKKLMKIAYNAITHKCVFVHCRLALQRTSTFIAIFELVRFGDKLKMSNNDQLRAFLVKTLEQIADTDRNRYPTLSQLELLFSNEFLDRVRNFAGE